MAGSRAKSPTFAPAIPAGWPEWADHLAMQRLQEALAAPRVSHAFLISGPKGVGKAALATAFAQAICCSATVSGDRARPCGECRACRNVARGIHPDVERFDLEGQAVFAEKGTRGANLSIDTIRRLRSSSALLPLESTRRILIIDDAETMLEPAQQALLKTLEDPPSTVILLLLADEPDRLLETVRSRCHHVIVRPVSLPLIEAALQKHGVDPERAADIAALSRGCPAWAIAAAAEPRMVQGRREEWNAAAEWLRSAKYERLVTAFRYGEQFSKRRAEVVGVVQAAVQILRAEMLQRLDGNPSATSSAELPISSAATPFDLSQAVKTSLRCLADLDANVRPRLALEAMVLSWPSSDH
jgi:DNA polymerase III subunit delta'